MGITAEARFKVINSLIARLDPDMIKWALEDSLGKTPKMPTRNHPKFQTYMSGLIETSVRKGKLDFVTFLRALQRYTIGKTSTKIDSIIAKIEGRPVASVTADTRQYHTAMNDEIPDRRGQWAAVAVLVIFLLAIPVPFMLRDLAAAMA